MSKVQRMGSVRKTALACIAGGLLAVSGCSGSDATEPPPPPSPSPSSSAEEKPQRTAPAKAVNVEDQCSVVSEPQWRALGADQPPSPRVAGGDEFAGCDYRLGTGAGDWTVFVAAVPQPLEAVAERTSLRDSAMFAGYPALSRTTSTGSCITALDVAEQGTLLVQSQVLDAPVDPCELTSGFAEAALSNLPDAPGGQ